MAILAHPHFPHAALGYRCNPFRTLTDEEWEAIFVPPPGLEALLEQDGAHLQILGEAGRGKSTALRGLAVRFRDAGLRPAYEYLPDGLRTFRADAQELDVFLLDEVQRLTFWQRRRLLAVAMRGVRLILGSHEDLTPLFKRRRLALRTLSLDEGAREHAREVVRRRLAFFMLAGVPRAELTDEAFAWLWHRYGTDYRSVETLLYHLFEKLTEPRPITPDDLQRCWGSVDERTSVVAPAP